MRRNYYDQSEWGGPARQDPAAPPPRPPVPTSRSAVEAPGPSQQLSPYLEEERERPCRTPNAWRRPPRRAARRSAPDRSRGVQGFLLCLSIILILTCVGLYLRIETPSSVPSPGNFGPFGGEWRLPGGWNLPGQQEDNWLEELKDTTAPRSAVGDGTVLTLEAPGSETLTPQEVYRQVSPAIVGVRTWLDRGMALGSGIVMSEEGYIITNAHVIAGGRTLEVVLPDNSQREALLVGYDGETDLAVLKIAAGGLTAARFGDSAGLQVGEPAYAIGNPLGEELRGTMTDGIVSAIDRPVRMDDGTDMSLIQTTAALNSGNSGGALINAAGQVVGITNMKMMDEEETIEGLGFAIPTATAKEVVDHIIALGFYPGRPMLGITVSNRSRELGLPAGAYVEAVDANSNAYAQGIRPGDVLTRAGEVELNNIWDLENAKAGLGVGDVLTLEVWTDGETWTVEVTLAGSSSLTD